MRKLVLQLFWITMCYWWCLGVAIPSYFAEKTIELLDFYIVYIICFNSVYWHFSKILNPENCTYWTVPSEF